MVLGVVGTSVTAALFGMPRLVDTFVVKPKY